MIRFILRRALRGTEDRVGFLILAAALALFAAQPAFAHGYKIGQLEIGHPWARMTPAGAKVGGGYLAIENKGTEPDRLVSVTAEIADRAEIHEMTVKDGVMNMRMLADGIEIPAGGEVKLAPGGYHLMLIGLKQPLKEGERFKGTLTFAKAGTVDVEFKVEGMAGPKGAALPAPRTIAAIWRRRPTSAATSPRTARRAARPAGRANACPCAPRTSFPDLSDDRYSHARRFRARGQPLSCRLALALLCRAAGAALHDPAQRDRRALPLPRRDRRPRPPRSQAGRRARSPAAGPECLDRCRAGGPARHRAQDRHAGDAGRLGRGGGEDARGRAPLGLCRSL